MIPHHDRNSRSRFLEATGCLWTTGDYELYVQPHQFGRKRTQAIYFPIRPPVFNVNVFTFQVSQFAQAVPKRFDAVRNGGSMHQGEELSLVTRSSDGQMLFLANLVSKMNRNTPLSVAVSLKQTRASNHALIADTLNTRAGIRVARAPSDRRELWR